MKPTMPPTHRRSIRKSSLTDSIAPHVKASLKKICLERARQKRRTEVANRRRRHHQCHEDNDRNMELHSPAGVIVRQYLHEEIKTTGISFHEEELIALMHEIEEELEREEDNYLSEEMHIMEEEARQEFMINEQIEEYQDSITGQSNISLHDRNMIPCPLCQTGNLVMRNQATGIGIVPVASCQRTSSTRNQHFGEGFACKFCSGVCFGEGVTLGHIKLKLAEAYEEHSRLCTSGVLQFDICEIDGKFGLVGGCKICLRRALLASVTIVPSVR